MKQIKLILCFLSLSYGLKMNAQIDGYVTLGVEYYEKGKYYESAQCLEKAILIWEKESERDYSKEVQVYRLLGHIYLVNLNQDDKAKDCLLKYLKQRREKKIEEDITDAELCGDLANMYMGEIEVKVALYYYKKELEIKEKYWGKKDKRLKSLRKNIKEIDKLVVEFDKLEEDE